MKIETITYKRIKNLGNYENEAIEVVAALDESEDPAEKLDELRDFVAENFELPERVENLKNQYESLKSQTEAAREKWQKVEKFLQKLGIDPTDVDDTPPF